MLSFDTIDRDENGMNDERKTFNPFQAQNGTAFERRSDGSIVLRSFNLASQILRSAMVRQAGFNADLVAKLPQRNTSVLFMAGDRHRRQRSAVARFFAPAVVIERYGPLMQAVSTGLVDRLTTTRTMALDDMSLELSVAVVAQIVGLTNSARSGLTKRLSRFFDDGLRGQGGFWNTARFIVSSQANLLLVYALDVRPALMARKSRRQDDLISHLLDQGWSHFDILTECVTYATAGISTTREFIVVAVIHVMGRDDLRQQFLASDHRGQCAILEEILRLEPAVGTLYRRANEDLVLDRDGIEETIAKDTLIAVDVRGVNADPSVTGPCPHRIDLKRSADGHGRHMSFGDGPHKCPGASVAIQEAVIFLNCLLRTPGLRLINAPTIGWNATTQGYILRGVSVASHS